MAKPIEIWEVYICHDMAPDDYVRGVAAFTTEAAAQECVKTCFGMNGAYQRLVLWPGVAEWKAAGRPDTEDDIDLDKLAQAETGDGQDNGVGGE